MRNRVLFAVALVAGCGSPEGDTNSSQADSVDATSNAMAPTDAPSTALQWDLQASGEGTALALIATSGAATVRLFCPSESDSILVNVSAFEPVGSEERMAVGSGGNSLTLVADPRGDPQRGGVSGTGEVPDNLGSLLAGPLSINYGAQNSGPHPAPPAGLTSKFVAACQERSTPAAPVDDRAASVSPCLIQDNKALDVRPLRAVGTEPFWAARIEGRCVTYSHPEDQDGTRVWTRYAPGANGAGTWSGTLGSRPFKLVARPQAGCSDGMSDKRYPMAVELQVNGERRQGCAERS
jgi:uncharacterized membrane protein